MKNTQVQYAIKTETSMPFDSAVEAVRVAFKAEGFGVLTEIDVSATMKAKLDADMPPYLILGMCNPQLAHRALMQETDIGVMLPCNVAVYEAEGHVVVAAQDPRGIVSMTGNDKLNEMADEAESRIRRAIKSLG